MSKKNSLKEAMKELGQKVKGEPAAAIGSVPFMNGRPIHAPLGREDEVGDLSFLNRPAPRQPKTFEGPGIDPTGAQITAAVLKQLRESADSPEGKARAAARAREMRSERARPTGAYAKLLDRIEELVKIAERGPRHVETLSLEERKRLGLEGAETVVGSPYGGGPGSIAYWENFRRRGGRV